MIGNGTDLIAIVAICAEEKMSLGSNNGSGAMCKRPLCCFTVAALTAGGPAQGQQSNPLIGSWTIVYANDERAEGVALPLYGPKPVGLLIFEADGHYSLQICASGRPMFVSNDRLRGTPEEYRGAASACNSHWGRYQVDESEGTIVFKIEHALFPNWEGTEQRRPFKMANGYLRYQVLTPSTPAHNTVLVWEHAR